MHNGVNWREIPGRLAGHSGLVLLRGETVTVRMSRTDWGDDVQFTYIQVGEHIISVMASVKDGEIQYTRVTYHGNGDIKELDAALKNLLPGEE